MDTGYTFRPTPFVRYVTSERLKMAHGKKGPTAYSVSSERHWQSGIKEIAKVSKRPYWYSNPRALDCQSRALTVEPPRKTICQIAAPTYPCLSGRCLGYSVSRFV